MCGWLRGKKEEHVYYVSESGQKKSSGDLREKN